MEQFETRYTSKQVQALSGITEGSFKYLIKCHLRPTWPSIGGSAPNYFSDKDLTEVKAYLLRERIKPNGCRKVFKLKTVDDTYGPNWDHLE